MSSSHLCHGNRNAPMDPPAKYQWMGGYVVTYEHGSSFPKIVGRVFGQEGYAHYQIAGRPHDEVSVGPFADRQAAFDEMVKILERRNAAA